MKLDTSPKYSYQDVFIKPKYSSLRSRMQANTSVEFAGLDIKIPVFISNMDTITESDMAIAAFNAGAIAGLHRFMSIEENVREYKKVRQAGAECFCSLGVKDYVNRLHALYSAGCRRFIVDIANAWCIQVEELMQYVNALPIRKELFIILGNVGTPEGALALQKMGADAVKTLVGSGSICTTKNTTGVNSPTFSCVYETCNHPETSIPIIADGGCKEIGDFAKALGAGATLVMSGSFFAGCQETPPVVKVKKQMKMIEERMLKEETGGYEVDHLARLSESIQPNTGFVTYRGMASFWSMKKQSTVLNDDSVMKATPEGKEVTVAVKGPVGEIIEHIAGGIRSAMSYCNAKNLDEFRARIEFGVRYNSTNYS
jgi:IMP dehydrogenase/GMP reductase